MRRQLPYGATLTPKGLTFIVSRSGGPKFGWWWIASPLVLIPVVFGLYLPAIAWMAVFCYAAWSRTESLGVVQIELRSDRMLLDGIAVVREPMEVAITGGVLRKVDTGEALARLTLDDQRARWLERAIAAWSRGRPLPDWTPRIDPKAIGVLEPGRQTIAVQDPILTPVDLAAAVLIPTAGATLGIGWAVAGLPLGGWALLVLPLGSCALALLLHRSRSGPTVLVLREGGLTLTHRRRTWSLPLPDIVSAHAERRLVNSEVVVELADGPPAVVQIGGFHRAEALAAAILAARDAHDVDPTADAEARAAFERMQGFGATERTLG